MLNKRRGEAQLMDTCMSKLEGEVWDCLHKLKHAYHQDREGRGSHGKELAESGTLL